LSYDKEGTLVRTNTPSGRRGDAPADYAVTGLIAGPDEAEQVELSN